MNRITVVMTWRALVLSAALCGASAASCAEDQKITIHVVGNGWHAGLLLPAAAINALVPALRERFPKAELYEIGWGDMGFYQAKEVTAGLAVEALFASKGSLLHVLGVSGPLPTLLPDPNVAQTCVSPAEYQRMAQRIAQAFALGNDGQPVPMGPGLYGDSQFYKANGEYSWLNTCNRWTAEVLQVGGLSMSPRISLTAGSVLRAVRQQTRSCPAAGDAARTAIQKRF